MRVSPKDTMKRKQFIKGAFLLRRKTLSNSLAAALPGSEKSAIAEAIARAAANHS